MTKSPNLTSFFRCGVALGAAALLAASAQAGPDKNPIVENLQRPFDWSGFYIGGNIGGVFSQYEFEGRGGDSEDHLFSDVDISQQVDAAFAGLDVVRFFDRIDKDRPDREDYVSAILGGGQIGYQHQFGHWVIGIEGDFDRTSIRNSHKFRDFASTSLFDDLAVDAPNGPPPFSVDADTDFTGSREAITNWLASVRGKFGYATGPLLFYATAGVAFAGVDVWAHDVANTLFTVTERDGKRSIGPRALGGLGTELVHIVNTDIDKDDDVMVGYTAGAGLEIAFNDAVSLALEYRHNGFGDETFNFNHHNNDHGHGGPIFPGATNVSFDGDQVTVRMNILLCHMFGHGAYTTVSPATNNVAVTSPFGDAQNLQVGYTRAKDADKWSAKDKEITKVEEPFNWTGFYIGANAGGVWTDYDFNNFDAAVNVGTQFDQNFTAERAVRPNSPDWAPLDPVGPVFAPFGIPGIDGGSDDSIIGGGQIGYLYQWGHWVFGVEGDFSGMSTDKHTDYASTSFALLDNEAIAVPTLYTDRMATVDWTGTARARIGYARGPVMIYLTGGGAWAKVRTQATDLAVTNIFIPGINTVANAPTGFPQNSSFRSPNNTDDDDVIGGWTAGGGGEWAFSKIASLGIEYRHTEYDSADGHYDPHHSFISAQPYSVDLSSDQVTVRINLLLGRMGPGH